MIKVVEVLSPQVAGLYREPLTYNNSIISKSSNLMMGKVLQKRSFYIMNFKDNQQCQNYVGSNNDLALSENFTSLSERSIA